MTLLQAIWDWVILFLVIYTAIFTPYVAAFLLNEPGYSDRSTESYGSDPIVIIDLIGKQHPTTKFVRGAAKKIHLFIRLSTQILPRIIP